MRAAAAAGPREEARGHLAMLLFSGLVAGSFILGALAMPYVDAGAFTALRFVVAAAALGVLAAMSGLNRAQFRAPWRYLLLGGIFTIYFVTMFEGLRTAAPVSQSAVFTLVPLMSAGFGWLIMRQVTTRRMALALAVGAAGAVWVIFQGDLGALARFELGRGERIYFFGCLAHAIYAPLVPRLNRGEAPLVFTFGTLSAGAVLLCAWFWPQIRATDWLALPGIVWFTLVYTAIVASAITGVLLQFASLRLKSAKVMAYTYLVPSWVILYEVALGRGLPPAIILGGVTLTIIALLVLLKD